MRPADSAVRKESASRSTRSRELVQPWSKSKRVGPVNPFPPSYDSVGQLSIFKLIRMRKTNRNPFLFPGLGRGHDVFVVRVNVWPPFHFAKGAYGFHPALRRDSFSALISHRCHESHPILHQISRFPLLKNFPQGSAP